MFKVVKILNSCTNQPEPCRLPVLEERSFERGTLIKYSYDSISYPTGTEMPTHVVGETKHTHENDTILCYAITPDMIFEAPVMETPTLSMLGKGMQLLEGDGKAYAIDSTEGGHAYVYDLMGAKGPDDQILVRFM